MGKLLDIKSRQIEPRTDLAAEVAPKLEPLALGSPNSNTSRAPDADLHRGPALPAPTPPQK
jgi:hypothetical protein